MTTNFARTERHALCDAFEELGPDAPTLCEGWQAKDLAAHLVVRERRPDLAVGMVLPPLAGRLERGMDSLAEGPWVPLVDLVRAGPPAWSPTRLDVVDRNVNTVEFVVHHEDLLRGDGTRGPRREVSPELERVIWAALRRTARLMFRKATVGVVLTAPGFGSVTAHQGEDPVVLTGSPVELLLTAYGRGHAAEVTREGDPDKLAALDEAELGLA